MSSEDFLHLCEPHLKGRDLDRLQSVRHEGTGAAVTALKANDEWVEWEKGLRNELVRVRAERLNVDAGAYLRKEAAARRRAQQTLVRSALSASSPLAAEKILNQARWKALDQLEEGNYFTFPRLVIYLLKLTLLEKIALNDPEKGRMRLDRLLAPWSKMEFPDYEVRE